MITRDRYGKLCKEKMVSELLARFKVNRNDVLAVFKAVSKEDFQDVVGLLPQGTPIIALGPTANWTGKVWPPERFAQAAEKLAGIYNFKILILGGPKEIHLADKIAREIKIKTKSFLSQMSLSAFI